MPTVRSFPPVVTPAARVLILGSMPGERSLAAGQYYAHPANAFWPIVGAFCGFAPSLPYAERLAALGAAGIALWDVLAACERAGSLDSAIVPATARCNDFVGQFAAAPDLRAVLCNGGTAHATFVARVLPGLGALGAGLRVVRLPSTSPAHAGLRPPQKRLVWHAALCESLPP